MSTILHHSMLGSFGKNERSLRFSGARSLTRVASSTGSRRKSTLSVWLKMCDFRVTTAFKNIILSGGALAGSDFLNFTGDATYGQRFQLDFNYAVNGILIPSQIFVDNAAWGHLVIGIDTEKAVASDRVKFYWNGNLITDLVIATYPTLNYDFVDWNVAGKTMMIGNTTVANLAYNGYMAHFYWIDGQQLAASDFGRVNANTGEWMAKPYSGAYGTNGCYLKFSNSTTTAALGRDYSGNGNHFTANNFSVTTNTDSMFDSPITANYAIWDFNHPSTTTPRTFTLGNLQENNTVAGAGYVRSTIGMQSGKWYAEFYPIATGTANECMFGLVSGLAAYNAYPGSDQFGMAYRGSDGKTYLNGVATVYGDTFTSGDKIGVAFDADNGKLFFSKNNVWQNGGDPVAGTNPAYSSISMERPWHFTSGSQAFIREAAANFGQYQFAYTIPSGYSALNSLKMAQPAVIKPSIYVNAALHTGSAAPVVVNSLLFSPNLVWIKNRSANVSHYLFDTARTNNVPIFSDSINAEGAAIAGVTIDSNGYSLPANTAGISTTANNFVSWNFAKNVLAGFDIVKYTGNNTANRLINHGLGNTPEFGMFKSLSATGGWYLWHRDYGLLGAQNYFGRSDSTGGVTAPSATNTPFGTGSWTTSQFMVTNNATNNLNANAVDYIAYLWRSIPGYSSIFSFVGNALYNGPMIYTGFLPRMYMYFGAGAGDNTAFMMDTARTPSNRAFKFTYQHKSYAEFVLPGNYDFCFLSNGFKINSAENGANWAGNRMYGIAFAEFPFRYARAK